MARKIMLACGIAAAVVQIAINAYVPAQDAGYDWVSQTVSELSAIGAPTRTLWLAMSWPYTVLLFVFGLAVWRAAEGGRTLRRAGGAILLMAVIGAYWPPMHLRGEPFTTTDALHIAWAIAVLGLMLVSIWSGAAALGRGFRVYSVLTVGLFVVFGALTFLEAPALAANAPTPYIGLWERINMASYAVWVMAFAVSLLRAAPAGLGASTRSTMAASP